MPTRFTSPRPQTDALAIQVCGVDPTSTDAAVSTVQHHGMMFPTAFNDGTGVYGYEGPRCTHKDPDQLLYIGMVSGRRVTLRFDRKRIVWQVSWAPRLSLVTTN